LRIEQNDDRFEVAYLARCAGPDDTSLVIDVRITGSADRLDFVAEAITPSGFETNRCGFQFSGSQANRRRLDEASAVELECINCH
ncbi:hypothetical protein ACEQ6A_35310, partial [Rhizobium brockwellii]